MERVLTPSSSTMVLRCSINAVGENPHTLAAETSAGTFALNTLWPMRCLSATSRSCLKVMAAGVHSPLPPIVVPGDGDTGG